jgi:hypothetical protein
LLGGDCRRSTAIRTPTYEPRPSTKIASKWHPQAQARHSPSTATEMLYSRCPHPLTSNVPPMAIGGKFAGGTTQWFHTTPLYALLHTSQSLQPAFVQEGSQCIVSAPIPPVFWGLIPSCLHP